MQVRTAQSSLTVAGLPGGHRVPQGNMRWYLVHTPAGMEQSTCKRLLKLIPGDLLTDAFTLHKERWEKRGGVWSIRRIQMYPEYFFAVSRDVQGLNSALQKLSFHVDLVGSAERSVMPLSEDARAFFEGVSRPDHVIRSSTGVIEGGALRVTEGPLVGCEHLITKVDRHKRRCWVSVGEPGGGFLELLPLEVPKKA